MGLLQGRTIHSIVVTNDDDAFFFWLVSGANTCDLALSTKILLFSYEMCKNLACSHSLARKLQLPTAFVAPKHISW